MKKILMFAAALAILTASVFAAIFMDQKQVENGLQNAGEMVHASAHVQPEEAPAVAAPLTGVTNILLIGEDNDNLAGMEAQGNSDGVLLCSINAENQEVIFTSFLRDTRVQIGPGVYTKLTLAYHEGGVPLLRNAMEENFGVPIDYYALFNYLDVVEIIEAVDGVELEVSAEEIAAMEPKIRNICTLTQTDVSSNRISTTQAGKLHLNGIQATAYMRIRPAEGHHDFGRTERGREVVQQIIHRLYAMDAAAMLHFTEAFYQGAKTDLPYSYLLTIAANAGSLQHYAAVSDRIPLDGAYTSLNLEAGFYIEPDFAVNNQHLQESIYEGKH